MPATILTTDDLREFKHELLNDIRQILLDYNTPSHYKQWLRSSEVQKLLKISPATLQNLRINGTLSFTKIGRLIYYNNIEIDKLIKERLVNYQNF